VTHEEASELLPAYALGALDEDAAELEAHLERCDRCCDRCKEELATYLETAARLGEAVETVRPPEALRQAVLAGVPERPATRRRRFWGLTPPTRFSMPLAAVAALLVVVFGLAGWSVAQQQQLQAARSALALDERGLVLLTSTETAVVRLDPVARPGSPEHGHWYHRPGVDTQVLVVEFLPKLPAGEAYYGWLQYGDGSWRSAGIFTLDDKGYGRLILVGDDGSGVRRSVVTRQAQTTTRPEGEVVLSWPAP